MIVSVRRVAERGGVAFALCLAVLGVVVLIHLALYAAAHAHAAHHHAPGAQTAISTGGPGAGPPSALPGEHAP